MPAVIICDCGQECTGRGDLAGHRLVPYTIWVNDQLLQNRYRRTCKQCETPARQAELQKEGFTVHQRFFPN